VPAETRERWDQPIRSKPSIELFDFSRSRFSEDAEGLVQLLGCELLPGAKLGSKNLRINGIVVSDVQLISPIKPLA
jgi:hypothetical protein